MKIVRKRYLREVSHRGDSMDSISFKESSIHASHLSKYLSFSVLGDLQVYLLTAKYPYESDRIQVLKINISLKERLSGTQQRYSFSNLCNSCLWRICDNCRILANSFSCGHFSHELKKKFPLKSQICHTLFVLRLLHVVRF